MFLKKYLRVGFTASLTLFVALTFSLTTVFEDNFETNKGWTVDPYGSDNATTGEWDRATPQSTSHSGVTYQLQTPPNGGSKNLVTGYLAGSSVGTHDIDNGKTSIRSPQISIPSGGTVNLAFTYYFAHMNNSSSSDYLRVNIVGSQTQTVFQELGAGNTDGGVWEETSVDISDFAGEDVYILIEAADNSGGSIVEAGIDDISVTQDEGVSLSPPWWTLQREIQNTIGLDRGVTSVTLDDSKHPMILEIRTSDYGQACALMSIMKLRHEFGGVLVDLKFSSEDSNDPPGIIGPKNIQGMEDIIQMALDVNGWYRFTQIVDIPMHGETLFLVLGRGVVQFWNDDLSDLYGNYNECAENVFQKILKTQGYYNGISYNLSTEQ